MQKILCIILLTLSSAAGATCLDLYGARGTSIDSVKLAVDCYRNEITKTNSALVKTDAMNSLSYLYFFVAAFGNQDATDANLQKSIDYAKEAAMNFGTWLDEAHYKTLSDAERAQISLSLYYYGTSLARSAERKGTITVVTKWPEIQKVMKMVMRLGHPEVAGYGAHRTLAIANTRMPPIAGGDKKLAEQYFKLAIQKTDRDGVSYYPANHSMYADLLLRLSRKDEACAQLEKVSALTDEEVSLSEPGNYEVTPERNSVRATYAKECAK